MISKKDRVAIVATVLYLLVPVDFLIDGNEELVAIAFVPVLLYWGYRFIVGDMSFLGASNDNESQ